MTVTQQRRVGSRRRDSDRWFTTERFDKEYAKAAPALRRLARQALTDYGFRERQQIVGRRLHDTVEGLSSHDVIELEIGGGHRLLLHVSGSELTLLRIGNHEIVRQYKRQGKLAESLRKREPIDFEQLCRVPMPSTLTQSPDSLTRYPGEVDPRWLYFLDLEQASITEQVLEHVEESLISNELSMDVITGGPGTGKTCILLQLLERVSEHSCWSDESWSVGLSVSPALQEQIQEATDWDIAPVVALGRLALVGEQAVDVLLVDDPDDLSDIDAYVDSMPNCKGHVVVVAVDPLQLHTSITDDQFTAFIDNHEANEYALSTCYRQKADVGALSTRVAEAVAQSSPFLREDKQTRFATERHLLHSTYNKLSFPNPSGYTKTYVGATQDDWTNHLDWVKRVSGRGLA